MKVLMSAKAIMSYLSIGSAVVINGAMNDMSLHSDSFMNNDQIKVVRRLDETIAPSKREVAAHMMQGPKVVYLPLNAKNSARINHEWEIRRVTNQFDEVDYDATVDTNIELKLGFKLIGNGAVRVDNDKKLNFDISFIHESGETIALYRKVDQGYEIIEARKMRKAKSNLLKKEVKKIAFAKREQVEQRDEVSNNEGTYRVVAAVAPKISGQTITSEDSLVGSMDYRVDSIESFNVTIGADTSKSQVCSLPAGLNLSDSKSFSTKEDIAQSGIVMASGDKAFKVRFNSGPCNGVLVEFVHEDKYDAIAEKREEEQRAKEEREEEARYVAEAKAEEVKATTVKYQNVRYRQAKVDAASIYDNQEQSYEEDEYVANLDVDQIDEKTEQSGYSF